MPRPSAEYITSKAEHVHVNEEACQELAIFLLDQIKKQEYDIRKWKTDNPLHPQQLTTETLDWIFVVDSLNFSFWPDLDKEFTIEGQVGYWALCAAINRAKNESIPITNPDYYSKLSLEKAKYIFRTDNGDITIPMLEERVEVLHQNGKKLIEEFNGSFANCLKQANSSVKELLNLIYKNFPSFRDESVYKGKTVRFFKRAQILIADIWACFEGSSMGSFEDIDQLTMFADYRIPQVLHYFNVLKYSEQLSDQLEKNSLLTNGSLYEVEIRGASIHAIELVREKLKQLCKNSNVSNVPNSVQIDFYLWGYRRDHCQIIDKKSPFHRVRCIFY